MKIVHISRTPIAGACHYWSESFKEAGYESQSIAMKCYGDGRIFHADWGGWPPKPAALEVLNDADLIFCHQGVPYRMPWYPKDKPTVVVYHSQPNHVHRGAEDDGWPAATLAQYHTRLYPGLPFLPNLIPLKHPAFQPRPKPDKLRVAYSPSNRDKQGWDDKGFAKTMEALNSSGVDFDLITNVPHEECMARKAVCHVCIDECATGSYHRSSLEALAVGCKVIVGADRECRAAMMQVTGTCDSPFKIASLSTLKECLLEHCLTPPRELVTVPSPYRLWMERCWNPTDLIERNFVPLMDAAFKKARKARPLAASRGVML